MRTACLTMLLLALCGDVALAENNKGAEEFIDQAWTGVSLTGVLMLVPPPMDGEIKTDDDFASIWKTWSVKNGPPPKIDFKKNRVVVYISKNQSRRIGHFLSDKGEFRFVEVQEPPTPLNGGFYYQIVVLKGDKVKSFNSQPLQANLNK